MKQDIAKEGSANEFVSHCYRMKLSDTQFMLAYIKFYITVIKDKICDDLEGMKQDIAKEDEKIEDEIAILEGEERAVALGVTKVEEGMNQIQQEVMNQGKEISEMAQRADRNAAGPRQAKQTPHVINEPALNAAIDNQLFLDALEQSR